jgi:Tol biopolymer transport system component
LYVPQLITEIATAYPENDAWVSPDGHVLYFTSNRSGTLDIYVAKR